MSGIRYILIRHTETKTFKALKKGKIWKSYGGVKKNRLDNLSFTGEFLKTENKIQVFYMVKIILNKITTILAAREN